jgi:predicted Zn-dependent peptidase
MPVQQTREDLTLPNGLHVVLCHAPRLKRSAASLRVAVGSHDAPQAWPGLAHFLEHLFFLGTERFAAADNLMTFIQRHGGQVNASTRERCTDFFFELPADALAQGLERLCDMLAHPRMAMDEQLREREVLHAEFLAWSRDAKARAQQQTLSALSPRHPLRGFHAGNRYSLPVQGTAFQQGLKDFYQRFYQAGQMRLCLTGPQSLDELRAIALSAGGVFAPGARIAQTPPPPLFDRPSTAPLLFACEKLPDGADEALGFFCSWLGEAQVIYQFAGQALLKVDSVVGAAFANKFAPTGSQYALVGADSSAKGPLVFFDWLTFFKTHWPALRHEYNLRQQLRLHTCSALDLAHHHARELPGELSEQGALALAALLDQLQGPTPATTFGWQLPAPNPFLTSAATATDEAALFVRWQLPAANPLLWRRIKFSFGALTEQANEAGVSLSFMAYDVYWQLTLTGLAAPMAAIVDDALRCLTTPNPDEPADEAPPIPIRQLLKHLPDYNLPDQSSETADLSLLWQDSHWIAFAHGAPLTQLLPPTPLPGTESLSSHAPLAVQPGRHWSVHPCDSTEHALLLFCPAPGTDLAFEAAWRLLAHLAQAPFYQRLRVELQLGYAVFSGIRQLNGQVGWLFGVQSPGAPVGQLAEHIEAFIDDLPRLVASADLPSQAKALAKQFEPQALECAQAAQLLWQAHLAGHGDDYFEALRRAIARLDVSTLQQAAIRLKQTFIYIATHTPERLQPQLD